MKLTILLLILASLLAGLFVLSGCNAAAQAEAAKQLGLFSTKLSEVIADTIVTPIEAGELKLAFEAMGQSFIVAMKPTSGFDWNQLVYVAINAALGGGVGLAAARALPNSLILGKQEAAALDKAAGTG